MPDKVIAIIGATGAQGGGLVRAILSDGSGELTARAITRDPSSEKAKAGLGWAPKHTELDDILASAWAWQQVRYR